MSRNVTLYELRTDIQEQADIKGATSRYGSTYLNRRINASRQKFAREISNAGLHHLLEPYSSTLAIGPTSPYQFQVLDLSAASPNMVAIYGIDVTVENERYSLLQIGFEQRSDFGNLTNNAQPQAWAAYQTRKVAIFPAPDQAYAFTAWYLPSLTDLSSDTDTWDTVAGWDEWVLWDVVTTVLARDTNSSGYQLAKDKLAISHEEVMKAARKVTRSGTASVRRDTLGQKMQIQRSLRDFRRDPYVR